jgi:Threonine dehydratase
MIADARSLGMIDVLRARRRIEPYIRRTPLVSSVWLSGHTGAHVSLKLETQQLSNSFKSRGAFNAVIARLERPRRRIGPTGYGVGGKSRSRARRSGEGVSSSARRLYPGGRAQVQAQCDPARRRRPAK